jgi:endonuclease-3
MPMRNAHCARVSYELLVATILSAQCTDERVNAVTPTLFAVPHSAKLADAKQPDVEKIIHSLGFFRAKATNLLGWPKVVAEFGGKSRERSTSSSAPESAVKLRTL